MFKEVEMSPEAEDLIRRFLCDRKDRIGSRGVEEIKAHPFFKGIDWVGIRNQRAPIIPHIRSPTDTSNFPVEDPDKFSDDSDEEEESENEDQDIDDSPSQLKKTSKSQANQKTKNQNKTGRYTVNVPDDIIQQVDDENKKERNERRAFDKKYPLYRYLHFGYCFDWFVHTN